MLFEGCGKEPTTHRDIRSRTRPEYEGLVSSGSIGHATWGPKQLPFLEDMC